VSDASDGVAGHFNLTVSVTSASGTTSDVFKNLNYSGVGTNSVPDFSDKLLVGSITFGSAGRPDNATLTCASGADGTVEAADYVGTAGTGNIGIALLEGDKSIRHVFADDPGNSFRATVNAGLKAHAELMGDRVAYINGDSGLTLAATISDVASYRSERTVYCDPWVYIYDDTTGAEQLVPPAPFVASVASQTSPSTSVAWKDSEVGTMLGGIVRLASDRGNGAADNTDAGVVTIIREEDGGHRLEAGKLTIYPSEPSKGNITRTRMGDYIAVAFVRSARGFVDAPNVPVNWMMEVGMLDSFMQTLVRNRDNDPNHTPYVDDYSIGDLAAVNSPNDLANGNFTIPLDVKIGSSQEKIFLSIRHGESVTVAKSV
jgi:phage tail sheath protein FI